MWTHRILIGLSVVLLGMVSCVRPAQVSSAGTYAADSDLEIVEEVEETEALPGDGLYRAERTQYFDLVHTRIDIRFDWAKQHALAEATLQLKPHFYAQDELELDAKGFDIHSVQLIKGENKAPLAYTYDGRVISISLDRSYTRQETLAVVIAYTAKPNELVVQGSEAIQDAKGLYFINPLGEELNKPQQIWTQGETESNSCWFPTIDSPNQKSTQEMYITVEDKFKTLSNGELVYSLKNADGTRTDYWKMEKPHAPYLFMMAIGEFEVVNDTWGEVPLSYWVEPEYKKYAKAIFGNTAEMMTFFSEKLEYPFPWNKYAQVVVRDYVSGAMENTTASVFMDALQVDSSSLMDKHWDYIIAHELFHQWFGDLVTAESWSNLTLNEAFANYSEYLWNEHKYGKAEADYHAREELLQYLDESTTKQVDLIRFYYEDREDMFDSHSYSKGGLILHMLRNYVGEEAFWKSLNTYLTKNAYKKVEAHQLRLAFEETTGEDLNWFFNQWFFASGHPEIVVDHFYQNDSLYVTIEQVQDIDKTPVFILPTWLDVWVDGKKESHYLLLSETVHQFVFPVAAQPQALVFDSKLELVAEIEHQKTISEWLNQYHLSDNALVRNAALEVMMEDSLNAEVPLVFKKALKDDFWANREMAAYYFDSYQGEDASEISALLKTMTVEDTHSAVRAAALSSLVTLTNEGVEEIVKQALQDKSYLVSSSALYTYYTLGFPNASEEIEKKALSKDGNTLLVVGSYYVQSQVTNKGDWFIATLNRLQGGEKYYFLQMFGQYLVNQSGEEKQKGLEAIYQAGLTSNPYYIRMATFQLLTFFQEEAQVPAYIETLKAKETHPEVLDYMSTFE
ncbi:M1 family metallopeptidase [Cytophagales bacterium LB-30]|uniref:Aminopeptidase N n=1 Tax=Shiella aurantiaca TaxID=3058365 RepID=A0ABT8F787_9BACT|nr:M1 family metallopeptidase [Shiella aurantiaca]MDN4166351.1 M1 family metallopeptidase [Shiella aurantiaca]